MWVPDDCVTENTYDDLLTVIPGRWSGARARTSRNR
jgi:hypothetical protein